MTNKRILIPHDNEATLEVVTEASRYESYEVLDIRYGYQLSNTVTEFSSKLIRAADYDSPLNDDGLLYKPFEPDDLLAAVHLRRDLLTVNRLAVLPPCITN